MSSRKAGYSSLAEAGCLVACERYEKSLEVAKKYYERAGVLNECIEHHAETWLRLKKRYQDALPKYTTKLLFSADVKTNVST
ncbi:hypothetical protein QQ045_002356 [Rhodiola kirilowii]